MPYTPPPKNACNMVVGGPYTPPPRTACDMQLGDDPIFIPMGTTTSGVNTITIHWSNTDLSYMPHAENPVIELYQWTGSTWEKVDEKPLSSSGSFVVSNLLEGNEYRFFLRIKSNLAPDPKVSDSDEIIAWTDYMLEVTKFEAGGGIGTLPGAVVIAVPEEEFLESVQRSNYGTDWPPLSYRRVNKTDENGTCSIRIPGGKGKAWVIVIPPRTDVSGDASVHVETTEGA